MKMPLSACRQLRPFRRYLRSKCEVVQNRSKFWTVFALPNFKGGEQSPQKLYPRDHACLAARHPEKFGEVAHPNPKVIGAHNPNFKPIFECLLLIIVGGPPSPMGCALGSLSHSLAHVEI